MTLVLTVFINWTALAQDPAPGDFGGVDDTNPTDASPVPIDDYVVALVLLGIGFAFYKNKALPKKVV